NGDDASAGTHINQAAAVAKELLGDVRSTVSAMRDSDAGDITEALERMASAVPSLEVHVRVDDDVRPDESQATVLIRAAQEIMTNTVKHTEAAELSIEISRTNGVLRLLGKNDGNITSSYTPGNGLRGLEDGSRCWVGR
ncbi:MAG: two-component sensor histidine kinase, partial [Corynebacterium sp.]|uniref:sensor histidine kinase n=1 Tax=Corynebacterium sp. TaxID=1720 RepID=UPI0026549DF4|nr:two-component sensor histidine kinase [Corynebacterium sp.]